MFDNLIPGSVGLLQLKKRLRSLERLQSLESLERLQSLQRLPFLHSLQHYQGSYDAITIKPNSVIYCDIPYYNTDGYQDNLFDYESFYSWCEKQTEPVFISEYWMPEDRFICIAEKEKSVMLCSGAGNKAVEKIFMPIHQASLYRPARYEQLDLF